MHYIYSEVILVRCVVFRGRACCSACRTRLARLLACWP
jgi:hypothetical protein